MRIGFYPGSFNPWHQGHEDVLKKAFQIFDKVVILQLSNAGKDVPKELTEEDIVNGKWRVNQGILELISRPGTSIIEAAGTYILGCHTNKFAIIRGLRNERDFCDEQILNYWYEDLGIKMPIVYVIADRSLVHISSSAIRAANKFTE